MMNTTSRSDLIKHPTHGLPCSFHVCCLNAEDCEVLGKHGAVIWKKPRSSKYYVEVFDQPEITTVTW